MNFAHLKKVPPIDNPAPAIHKRDHLWSDVFEKAASKLDTKQVCWLCMAIGLSTGRGQATRMCAYINRLLCDRVFVTGWLSDKNLRAQVDATDMFAYRAAWARHLAAQFRAKGL